MTGELLQELRRGADKADIFCLAFNANSSYLAVTSDKGTVHIFRLKDSVVDHGLPLSPALHSAHSGHAGTSVHTSATAAGTTTSAGISGGVGGGGGGAVARAGVGSAAVSGSGEPLGASSVATGAGGAAGGSGGVAAGGSGGVDGGSGSGGAAAATASGALTVTGTGGGSGGGGAASAVTAVDNHTKSSFSFMKGILPKYFSSEWSYAQFRVPDTRSIVAFGSEPNTIIGTSCVHAPQLCT